MRYSLLLLLWSTAVGEIRAVDSSRSSLELEPISDDGWEGALHKRDQSIYSKVHLQENEHFVWGSPAGANQIVYVNMTMGTKDDELILSMERFSGQLKSVNCNETMMMTFNSNTTYQHAVKSWDWVNFSQNRTFIMIANHPSCGREKSRSPWIVSNVDYDPTQLRVTLNATRQTWQDVAHTYTLDFGHYAPPDPTTAQQNASLAKRWKFDKSFPLDLNHQLPSEIFGGASNDAFDLSINCPGCGTKGQLVLAGHVEVHFFGGLKAFKVSATPHGIGAAVNLKIKVGGTLPTGGFSQTMNLATLDLGGFSIPGILTLGPTFNIDAGVAFTSLQGAATFSTGASASIPDSSVAEIDLAGDRKAEFSGWTPTFTTSPLSVDAKISAGIDIFTKLSVAASLLVLGNGFSVSLGLKLPDVSLTAVGNVNPDGGVCRGSTKTIGVALDASIGAVLELQGFTEVLGTKHMFLNDPLFNSGAAFMFEPVCLAFGSDTRVAKATPSAAIEVTATTAQQTNLEVASSTTLQTISKPETTSGSTVPIPQPMPQGSSGWNLTTAANSTMSSSVSASARVSPSSNHYRRPRRGLVYQYQDHRR